MKKVREGERGERVREVGEENAGGRREECGREERVREGEGERVWEGGECVREGRKCVREEESGHKLQYSPTKKNYTWKRK